MQLSKKAISDLRLTLDKCIVKDFSDRFTDEQVEKLGMFFLVSLAGGLKLRVKRKQIEQFGKI